MLAGYAAYAAPLLGVIPLVGTGMKGTADYMLAQMESRAPWHKQIWQLSLGIQSLGRRVLIVVDDVERLGGDELLTLLRAPATRRFRGVHCLIAYDQDTVEDLLRATGAVCRLKPIYRMINRLTNGSSSTTLTA